MALGLILFDFDGTLYRGDEPFRIYARELAAYLPPQQRDAYLEQVSQHLNGVQRVAAGDNWEAVAKLVGSHPIEDEGWTTAFSKTRQRMMDKTCALEVPLGLPEFLQEMKGRVRLGCATNSPWEAAVPLLTRLGIAEYFDAIIPSAHKPQGLMKAAQQCWGGPVDAARALSVGDNYGNDIAPAVQSGWSTAYISPWGDKAGPCTFFGTSLEELLPTLREWVDGLGEG